MKKLLLLSDDRPLSHKKIEVCIKYIFFQIVSLHLLQHCFIIKLEFVSYKQSFILRTNKKIHPFQLCRLLQKNSCCAFLLYSFFAFSNS